MTIELLSETMSDSKRKKLSRLEKRFNKLNKDLLVIRDKKTVLERKALFLQANKFSKEEVTQGRGKTKRTFVATFMHFNQYFIDEDTNKKVKLNRRLMVEINGVPVDSWGNKIELEDDSLFEIPRVKV